MTLSEMASRSSNAWRIIQVRQLCNRLENELVILSLEQSAENLFQAKRACRLRTAQFGLSSLVTVSVSAGKPVGAAGASARPEYLQPTKVQPRFHRDEAAHPPARLAHRRDRR
jgi:hypothetical protein